MDKDLLTIDVEKYGGKQVAIKNNEVIASGNTADDVIKRVKNMDSDFDLKNIKIFSVPKTTSSIYSCLN